MKCQIKLILKFLFLSIVISCLAFGSNAETNKQERVPKSDKESNLNAESINNQNIIEEKQELEEWMFDREYWQIENEFEGDEKPDEETSLAEDWMSIYKFINASTNNIYSDFVEKEWMKKHHFLIL